MRGLLSPGFDFVLSRDRVWEERNELQFRVECDVKPQVDQTKRVHDSCTCKTGPLLVLVGSAKSNDAVCGVVMEAAAAAAAAASVSP